MQPYYTEISFYSNVYCLSKTTQFNMKGRVPGPGTRNEMAYCCFALFSFVFFCFHPNVVTTDATNASVLLLFLNHKHLSF